MRAKKRVAGPVVRYSEAFKRQVLRELAEGKHSGPWAAGRAYGIAGTATVSLWMKAAGRAGLLRKVVRVESCEERDQVKGLKAEIKRLKLALADAHLDQKLEAAYVKLACEAAGIEDVEGFKKKHAGKR